MLERIEPVALASMSPWEAYDQFVQGTSVEELAALVMIDHPEASPHIVKGNIRADIEQMRSWQLERLPGLSDEELDSYRRVTLLARQATLASAREAGAAAALKVLKECQDKQEELARLSLARRGGEEF